MNTSLKDLTSKFVKSLTTSRISWTTSKTKWRSFINNRWIKLRNYIHYWQIASNSLRLRISINLKVRNRTHLALRICSASAMRSSRKVWKQMKSAVSRSLMEKNRPKFYSLSLRNTTRSSLTSRPLMAYVRGGWSLLNLERWNRTPSTS